MSLGLTSPLREKACPREGRDGSRSETDWESRKPFSRRGAASAAILTTNHTNGAGRLRSCSRTFVWFVWFVVNQDSACRARSLEWQGGKPS